LSKRNRWKVRAAETSYECHDVSSSWGREGDMMGDENDRPAFEQGTLEAVVEEVMRLWGWKRTRSVERS
jgi:hypothetical protein